MVMNPCAKVPITSLYAGETVSANDRDYVALQLGEDIPAQFKMKVYVARVAWHRQGRPSGLVEALEAIVTCYYAGLAAESRHRIALILACMDKRFDPGADGA